MPDTTWVKNASASSVVRNSIHTTPGLFSWQELQVVIPKSQMASSSGAIPSSTSITPFDAGSKTVICLCSTILSLLSARANKSNYFQRAAPCGDEFKSLRGASFCSAFRLRPCCGRCQSKQIDYSNNQISLVSSGCPGRSVLLIALAAVNRPRSIRLEGNLGLLPAF